MRYAELKPKIPAISFPPRSNVDCDNDSTERPRMNTSRPRSNDIFRNKARVHHPVDIFDGDDLDFDEFLAAGTLPLFKLHETLAYNTGRPRARLGCRQPTLPSTSSYITWRICYRNQKAEGNRGPTQRDRRTNSTRKRSMGV